MARPKPTRVGKPRPDFPLFPDATNRWAKKVRGKLHYFGPVSTDPKGRAALDRWPEPKDALLASRTLRVAGDGLTIRDLCNRFLTAEPGKLEPANYRPPPSPTTTRRVPWSSKPSALSNNAAAVPSEPSLPR